MEPDDESISHIVQITLRVGDAMRDPASAVSTLFQARAQYRVSHAGDPTLARVSPAFYTRLEHEIERDVVSLFGMKLSIDVSADPLHLS